MYDETKDLGTRQGQYLSVIESNRGYAQSLKERRRGVSKSGGVAVTWYDGINNGVGVGYRDFDFLHDSSNQGNYQNLKNVVLHEIYKVKGICQELSFIEPWIIKFDIDNYKRMDAYLQEYNACPFCGYLSFDSSRCSDENFVEYLMRIEEDLQRAIDSLPVLYHHLDNTGVTLQQNGLF